MGGDGRAGSFGLAGDVLKGASGGGAYGDDSAAFAACFVDGNSSGGGEAVGLGVEMDVFRAGDADRLEGSEAYVEG